MNIFIRVLNRRFLYQNKELSNIRTLFTKDALGVASFSRDRELAFSHTPQPTIEEFKNKFRNQIDSAVTLNTHIFNLTRYLHLMNSSTEDTELLRKGLHLYQDLCDEWQPKSATDVKKNYAFGPIVMRALHFHNLPEFAIELFEDSKITHVFDQRITYQILLDFLYDEKMYGHVLRVYEEIRKRILAQNLFVAPAINAIVFATYYRLNTPSHFDLAYDLYNDLKKRDELKKQFQKSIALAAAMRLKRHKPNESLDILSVHDDISANIRYVRILSYACLKQFDEVFRLLELTVAPTHTNRIVKIPNEVLQEVEKIVKEVGNQNLIQRFTEIHDQIKHLDGISEESMDDRLCARFPTEMHKPKRLSARSQI